ncbi:hypothetical protein BJY00DRAFT_275696 [Aspergillus carlsbadensis]|nr:hypothetical protein BJY00DRAFT_275696 [Aspergillus carlsbadensis]
MVSAQCWSRKPRAPGLELMPQSCRPIGAMTRSWHRGLVCVFSDVFLSACSNLDVDLKLEGGAALACSDRFRFLARIPPRA